MALPAGAAAAGSGAFANGRLRTGLVGMVWPSAISGGVLPGLCGADHERTPGCLDHVIGDDVQPIDFQDALDLDEEAVQQPEIAACDARDGSTGLRIGEVGAVELQAELLQWWASTKESSSPRSGL